MTPVAHWRLARLSMQYLLDLIEITRGPGELLDPLILGVITSASVSAVGRDADTDMAFATLDATPPDELRRPISISAIAQSLRLPYETVRRRVRGLAASGRCVITSEGVVQTEEGGNHPRHIAEAIQRYERTRKLYQALIAAGAPLAPQPADPVGELLPDAPIRLVNRMVGEYSLRLADAIMREVGGLFLGMLLLELARANTEHLDDLAFSGVVPLPDEQRRPVPMMELGRRLRMPQETVRRHCLALAEKGLILRRTGGLILSTEGVLHSGLPTVARENAANLTRLFAQLARAGVLVRWDAELT